MKTNGRGKRFWMGLGAVVVVLVLLFSALLAAIPTWDATAEEAARTYPGDETAPNPLLTWTHGATIEAAPEQVWPWIAQLGDVRGGYYSYTFIENMVAGANLYHNAATILPEFQNPQPGDGLITGALRVADVKTGQYLLAESAIPDMVWTWIWSIEPAGENQTRLVVHTRIQPPEMGGVSGLVGFVINAGGFIMEQNMIQGLKLRAEGGSEFAGIEWVEIGLWLLALAAGLVCAVHFVRRGGWLALGIGLLCVVWLMVLTFVQPALGWRVLVDLMVLTAAVWTASRGRAA